MNKRILSILICGAVLAAPVLASTTGVTANAASTVSAYSLERADKVVDASYTGTNGAVSNGYSTYKTVQAAINSVPTNNSSDVVIYIKNGTYHEKITVNTPYINLIGQDQKKTILTYNVAAGSTIPGTNNTYGTSGSASLSVTGNAKGFAMANLQVENAFDENSSISSKQAVAFKNEADESMFINCRFVGNQDTLYTGRGKQYYYNCYIAGDVDFIFGGATAYFEKCEIKSYDRSGITPKGYITAPSTPASSTYGLVFESCKLTTNITQKGSVYLGRPWHAGQGSAVNSSAVFLNCAMGAHISATGWTSMNSDQPLDNRLYEYGSSGAGALTSSTRRVLSTSQAAQYSKSKVLSGWDTSAKAIKLNNFSM